MKIKILFSAFMLLSITLVAQKANLKLANKKSFVPKSTIMDEKINVFQINGENYFSINNAAPNANVKFFSKPSGGKMFNTISTNDEGNYLSKINEEEIPAFVRVKCLDNSISNTCHKIKFINENEFIINKLKLKKLENRIDLSFNMIVNSDRNVEIKIYKTDQSGEKELVTAFSNSSTLTYDQFRNDFSFDVKSIYSLEIYSNTNFRVSKQLDIESIANETFILYPTKSEQLVNVDFYNFIEMPISYNVIDATGKIVEENQLINQFNTIDISNYSKGWYYLKLNNAVHSETKKFLKL